MTASATFIEIAAGPLDTGDLGRAINEWVRRAFRPGAARLEGRRALEVRPEPGGVRVCRFVARSASGRRVEFENVPVPVAVARDGQERPVEVVIDWETQPIDEGSAVELAVPVLRAPTGNRDTGDGRFLLGYLHGDGLRLVPVPAERLDSCAAWDQWGEGIRASLDRADRALLLATARLARGPAPAFAWGVLLQPLAAALAEAAAAVVPDAAPEDAAARIDRFAAALNRCPERAEVAIGSEVATFVRDSLAGHPRGTKPQDRTCAAADGLERIAYSIGLNGDQFPELLYEGRVYRREIELPVNPVPGCFAYEFDAAAALPGAALAIRWPLPSDEALGYGDVVYHPLPLVTGQELYLQATLPGAAYQLITHRVGGRGQLRSHTPLPAPTVVLYQPLST
jgi:hypothetical protein